MDQNVDRRKVRFTPKAPQNRAKPTPAVQKTEKIDEDKEAAAQAQYLLRRFNENVGRRKPKAENKSSVQVAFGHGATSTSIRTFGPRRDVSTVKSSASELKDSTSNDEKIFKSSPSSVNEDGVIPYSSDATVALPLKIKKDHKEPWDYRHSYYPTTLPLRRPYSGDPELLDEAEFGEAARNMECEEKIIAASELGLLEKHGKERMFFFQLPADLPLVERSASIKGKEKAESRGSSKKGSKLEALSGGYMGKMLVYKSGAVKLKLGDILYDVSPGSNCVFAQDVVAINTVDKHCCALGELSNRAVVTPDVDSLLNSVVNLD
ncbi:RNA_pol_Rpc4 domain-containing protein [Cephalotus follicularis]|uniref:RNA_pol_Rpc4 domain-containing protein n=1 Tax=Cephalotus follicularis TaxID=3775 RepID=A0A1Q3D9B0_CEPFO|nr:RNA_pol_Rpc4 domain-containing protein [Cephalotus follicularis]